MMYRLTSPNSKSRNTWDPSNASTCDFGTLYSLEPEDKIKMNPSYSEAM